MNPEHASPLQRAARALVNAEEAAQAALVEGLPPLVRTQLLALLVETARTAGVVEALLEGFVVLPQQLPIASHLNLHQRTRTGA